MQDSISGKWLSILEYANIRNISISTIRRYIKANRVKYRSDNGKYYIFVSDEKLNRYNRKSESLEALTRENSALRREIKKLKEEIGELQMLVNLYEGNNVVPKDTPPEVPNHLS